jgi:hypothetical protein
MSATTGPFSLSLGQTTSCPNPSKGGLNFAAVQVQNASAFVLTVLAGGEQFTIQAFTASTVPLAGDGQPITLTAAQNPGNVTATNLTVTLVWLLPTNSQTGFETPPMLDGPLTSAAIVAAISGTITTQGATTLVGSGSFIAGAGGSGYEVLGPFSNVPSTTRSVLLLLQNAAVAPYQGTTISLPLIIGSTTGQSWYNESYRYNTNSDLFSSSYLPIYLPFYALEDTAFAIQLYYSNQSSQANAIEYQVLALPDADLNGSSQSPLFTFNSEYPDTPFLVTLTSGQQIVPAPPTGFYYRVKNISISVASSDSVAIIGATSGQYYYAPVNAQTGNVFLDVDILTSEALNGGNSGGVSTRFTGTYRLVPAAAPT